MVKELREKYDRNKALMNSLSKDNEVLKSKIMELMIEENGFKIGDSFIIDGTWVHISEYAMTTYLGDTWGIRYKLQRYKKDGTKGKAWFDSYGKSYSYMLGLTKLEEGE